jgi:hypothetical protein
VRGGLVVRLAVALLPVVVVVVVVGAGKKKEASVCLCLHTQSRANRESVPTTRRTTIEAQAILNLQGQSL